VSLPSLDPRSSIRPSFLLTVLLLHWFAPQASLAAPAATAAPPPTPLDSLVRAETRVRWEPGPPDSALARAQRTRRPAFLDFYADWCTPCRWMDRVVYSDPLLGEVSAHLAMIRVDIETPAGRALAQRYGVQQYPTLVYVQADGKEKLRWPGPLSLRDTRLNLAQTAFPSAGRDAHTAPMKQHPKDVAIQIEGLRWYGLRGEVENARAVAARLEKRSGAIAPSDLAGVRLALARAEEMAGRAERALEADRAAIAADSTGAVAWRAWLGVWVALERAGDHDGALHAARQARALATHDAFLDARIARLAMKAPPLATPPGVDDGTAAR
jgi:thiol-disulfide isomerase/thioredoxin